MFINQIHLYISNYAGINLLLHLTVEDTRAGGGWEAMSRLGRGCRARQCMANAGGAKGQMVLIGIPDMLDCVPVLVPLRSLLLYSHHMPSQNKMRLRPHSCMLKILRPAHRAKQLTKAPLRSVRFLTRCPLVMSLNRRCRQ